MTPDSPVFPRRLLVALIGLTFLACGLEASEIGRRGIDPDELEHLHAAYCVWRGEVPYRDFFEHHAPALYYLLWPVMKCTGPELTALWLGRSLMWLCGLAALWQTGTLAARWGGRTARILAMALLAWTTVYQAKAIELRPDVPAMLLLVVAISQSTYATGGGSWRRFLVVGLLAGAATLFTQKAIVPAAGIALAACLARLATRDSESPVTILARVLVPLAAGIAAVWGVATALFASAGAAADFWQSTWYQLWIWPVRSGRWEHLRPTVAGDLTVWIAALVEIVAVCRRLAVGETWREQRAPAVVVALVCIGSLAVVKATYPQYYLLWMPFLAALAAARLTDWCRHPLINRPLVLVAGCGSLLIVGEVVICERAFLQRESGSLAHLAPVISVAWPLSIGLICLAALVALGFVKKDWPISVVLLAGIGMQYGVLRDVDRALWFNREQVAEIANINRQIPLGGRVLDGFTGYAALRPHAWYYWWLNEYSLALIPERELRTGLLERLERNPPAGVLLDENVRRLPSDVLDWIHEHYAVSGPDELLWLRRSGQ